MAYEGKWLGDYVGEWLGAQENNPGAMSANIGGSGTIAAETSQTADNAGGAGSSKKKHRRIHPREIWEKPEAVVEKAAIVAKKLQVRGTYADIPLPDLEYAIAQLEKIVGADYEEDDIEALLLLL